MSHGFATRALAAGVFCTLLVESAAGGINTWTTKGPPGGFYRDIEVSSTDSNVFYAAYGRAFFRSTDGGATWQTGRRFTGEVVDVAVDPTDGNRIYLAILQEGVFRSEDAGQSFVKVAANGEYVWSVGVGGADGKTVYYATASGAFSRSTDRGATWTARPSTPMTLVRILVNRADANFLAAIRGSFFRVSSDGGASWTESLVGYSILAAAQVSAARWVVATTGGLFVSTDNGASWTQALTGFFFSVASNPNTPNTLIAAESFVGPLIRSTDGGSTWSAFGASPRSRPSGLIVAAGSPARIVAASSQGVELSTDDGASWTEASPGPIASDPLSMATTVASGSKVYVYTCEDIAGAGLFATSQDSSWQRLNIDAVQRLIGSPLGQGTLAVEPGHPQSIYFGAVGNGVFHSNDGGNHWVAYGAALSGFLIGTFAFDPADPRIMYATVESFRSAAAAALYRSTDGGISWAAQSTDLPEVTALKLVVDPADPARLFLAAYQGFGPAGGGGLYFSANHGVNWTQIAFAGSDVRDVEIDPNDSSRVYAAAASGLQVSVDGGASFTPNTAFGLITTQPASAIEIDPEIPTTIYAASADPGYSFGPQGSSSILRSVDRGQTWEILRAESESPRWFGGNLVLDPNNPALIYATTGDSGVAAFEVANDLAVSISGHSGLRPMGVPSTLNLKAENRGSLAATGVHLSANLPAGIVDVSVTTTLGSCQISAGVLTCDIPLLRPAELVDVQLTYTPPTALALPVAATLSAHEHDTDMSNNTANATAIVGEVVDLRVAVTPSSTSVKQGGSVSYSVQITNLGPIDASTASLTFTADSGLALAAPPSGCTVSETQISCELSGLASGASQTFSIGATASATGVLGVHATVAAAQIAEDTDTTNNHADANITATVDVPTGGGGKKSGGGGSFDYGMLVALLLIAGARRMDRKGMVVA